MTDENEIHIDEVYGGEAPTDQSAGSRPDERSRNEKLTELLAYAHVIGASDSEARFIDFRETRGRNPDREESTAMGLELEEPYPPFYECTPELYLGAVADVLRSEPESRDLPALARPHEHETIPRFRRKLELARKRDGEANIPSKTLLLCGLEALGMPSPMAHTWLRGLRDEEADLSRLKHFCFFVGECCVLPWGSPTARYHTVTTADLFAVYQEWCARNDDKMGTEIPFTAREFSLEILKCGGVSPWRTKHARGFRGIALRWQAIGATPKP